LIRIGKHTEAAGAIARARAALSELPPADLAVAREWADVAGACTQLAFAHQQASPDRAAAAFREAQEINEKLIANHPRVASYAVSLGGTYCNTGNLVRKGGKAEPALEWYDKAVRTLKAVVEADPANARGKLFLRNSHWGRALSLEQLQRHGDAVADWDQAIRLDDGGSRAAFAGNLARCLARAGLHERAGAAAEQMANAKGAASRLYDAACVLALAARAAARDKQLDAARQTKLGEQYAARAVALLRLARAAGYFQSATGLNRLKMDADLESLRSRGDYKKLLEELNNSGG
jgi:tetratricopeptide (TPR) repeat protein